MWKHLKNSRGNSTIILLAFMTIIIGVTAFTADAGMVYLEQSKLQNAVDAAALAGIAKFEEGETSMVDEAYHYTTLNKLDAETVAVTVTEDNHMITVTAAKNVPLYFAKIFDISSSNVTAKASAEAAPIVSVDGLRPLAVEQQDFVFGESYTLKNGASEGYMGNFGALALGGTGANNYRNNLMYGYHADLKIGDWVEIGDDVETQPGNMAGPTYDGISYLLSQDTNTYHDLTRLEPDCPRLIVIAIVDSLAVNGRSEVKVTGFAAFFLEDVVYVNGKTEITGKFIKRMGQGETDLNGVDCGLYGIKLVE